MEDNDVQTKSCNVIGQHFTVQWLGKSVIWKSALCGMAAGLRACSSFVK